MPKTQILNTRRVYEGNILDVQKLDLDFGNSKEATFEVINFHVQTGVSALPITNDEHVRLIRHYQAGAHKDLISLPTGGLEKGEDPEVRMQLELQEEIGCRAGKLTLMTRSHILPGYIGTEPGYLFLAEALEFSTQQGDEPFDIEVLSFPIDDALKMVQSGAIVDARTAHALLFYETFYRHPRF